MHEEHDPLEFRDPEPRRKNTKQHSAASASPKPRERQMPEPSAIVKPNTTKKAVLVEETAMAIGPDLDDAPEEVTIKAGKSQFLEEQDRIEQANKLQIEKIQEKKRGQTQLMLASREGKKARLSEDVLAALAQDESHQRQRASVKKPASFEESSDGPRAERVRAVVNGFQIVKLKAASAPILSKQSLQLQVRLTQHVPRNTRSVGFRLHNAGPARMFKGRN